MRQLAVAALAAGAALALCGCTITPIPKAADAHQIDAYFSRQLDADWKAVGLDDDQRPDVARVRFLAGSEYASVMSSCTTSLTPGYARVDPDASVVRKLAYYSCQAMYPVDPAGHVLLSTAQVDFLYSYYARWTIPCVRAHGIEVHSFPSLGDFRLANGLWNPIYHPGSDVDLSTEAYTTIASECDFAVVDRFPTG